MSIRNLWSLEPGECIIAEKILKELKGCDVYFPLHDVGVDLLIVSQLRHLGIQVKESRYFLLPPSRKMKDHSWHQIRKETLGNNRCDFYVFLTYLPVHGEHKLKSFEHKFLVVSRQELERRCKVKNPGKQGKYSFYFNFENEKVTDLRDNIKEEELKDYTKFLDAWNLMLEVLRK